MDSPRPETAALKPFGCSMTTYVRLRRKVIGDVLKGLVLKSSSTPDCGECRACCRFDANEAKKGDDLTLFVEDASGNKRRWILPRTDAGDCAYLQPSSGCTVYGRRPTLCRVFDCRDYLATGVKPEQTGKLSGPAGQWDLLSALKRAEDRQLYLAMRLMTRESIRSGGRTAEEIAGISLLHHERYLPRAKEAEKKLAAVPAGHQLEAIDEWLSR